MFGSGRRGWRGGEWMRGLGFGFTNPVGTWGMLYVVYHVRRQVSQCFRCRDS